MEAEMEKDSTQTILETVWQNKDSIQVIGKTEKKIIHSNN